MSYESILKTMNNFETVPDDKQRIRVFFIDGFYNGLYDAGEDCVWFGGGADEGAISREDLIAEAGMWKAV